MTDDLPEKIGTGNFEPPVIQENMTGTSGAFKTYNTVAPKMVSWKPDPTKLRSQ